MEAFDVQTKINLLHGDMVTDVKHSLQNIDGVIILKKTGIAVINGKKTRIPKAVNIIDAIARLKSSKSGLMIRYHDLYNEIVMYEQPTKMLQDQYTQIYDQIHEIEKTIEQMYLYLELVNNAHKEELSNLLNVRKQLLDKQALLDSAKESLKVYQHIQKVEEQISELKNNGRVVYYLEESAAPMTNSIKAESTIKEHIDPPKKEKKALKKVTPVQLGEIKENIKEILVSKLLKPQNKEECVSQKRSQSYYMSQKALVDEINKNPDLKALLPSNWKSLSKDKLCDILYK